MMANAWVLYLWRPMDGREPIYAASHVNRVAAMLRRWSPPDWQRIVCVTDDGQGLDADIGVVAIEQSLMAAGRRYPKLSFYRRDAAALFGADRICMVDLDCVVTGPLDPLVGRDEPIITWADPNWGSTPYNSSIVLMDAGRFPEVHERFHPESSDGEVRRSRLIGSDQAWLAIVLGRNLPRWKRRDGVLSFLTDCRRPLAHMGSRIVFFAGRPKPWEAAALDGRDWVREAWA